jgi:hypothetical protein
MKGGQMAIEPNKIVEVGGEDLVILLKKSTGTVTISNGKNELIEAWYDKKGMYLEDIVAEFYSTLDFM